MTMPRSRRAEGAVLAAIALVAACARATGPRVEDIWVASPPPGTRVLAAYLTIENPTTRELILREVASPDFSSVEIHETRIVGGVARMRPTQSVEIPAGGRVPFRPGGLHLMLRDPHRPIATGDRVVLELRFADGSTLEVAAALVATHVR